jgi:hypothetical protein
MPLLTFASPYHDFSARNVVISPRTSRLALRDEQLSTRAGSILKNWLVTRPKVRTYMKFI